MKKINPIDWLIENHFGGINNCTPDFRNKIKKAKEMHEEQIIDAFHDGWMNDEHEKDYYNKTFNK